MDVRRVAAVTFATAVAWPSAGLPQGPARDLWTVASTALAVPPALAPGAQGSFWNPAQRELEPARVVLFLEALDTPPEIGIRGVLVGASSDAPIGRLSLTYGRVSVGDLIRTSTNPTAREGTIEVYTQAISASWSRTLGTVRVGAAGRLLTNRLDDASRSEWALDVGIGWDVTAWLRLAGATQFFTGAGAFDDAALYLGAEGRVWHGAIAGIPTAFALRVGSATMGNAGTDGIVSVGIVAADRVSLDLAAASETSFGSRDVRTKLGLSARVGRYAVSAGMAGGVGDLGSTFRIGLQAALR